MAGGVPRFFSDEKAGESFRNLGLWLEWDFHDQLIAGLFGFRSLELVDVVAFRGKERKVSNLGGFGEGEF